MEFPPRIALSIVVPVHNMAGRLENLEKCMRNVSELGLPIQFILIHDGNDVDTQKELEALSSEPRTALLQVDVGSPGLARNRGIEVAFSPWISFWDSDDLGHPQEVFDAISISKDSTQVIVGGYEKIDYKTREQSQVFKPSRNLNFLMTDPGIWRFVFRREFIANKRFTKSSMGEDQVFLARLQIKSRDIQYFDTCFYSYFSNLESQLTSNQSKISEIREAIMDLDEISRNLHFRRLYIYVLRSRMLLTAYKNGVYSFQEFLLAFLGVSKGPLQYRVNCLQGSILVASYILKRMFHSK